MMELIRIGKKDPITLRKFRYRVESMIAEIEHELTRTIQENLNTDLTCYSVELHNDVGELQDFGGTRAKDHFNFLHRIYNFETKLGNRSDLDGDEGVLIKNKDPDEKFKITKEQAEELNRGGLL